jgi:tRNA pseudouridine55 synthase
VVRLPRQVTFHEHEILNFELPRLTLRIKCSKGTYIRSLARDLGEALGSKAYLSGLERTAIGDFLGEDALTPHEMGDQLKEIWQS